MRKESNCAGPSLRRTRTLRALASTPVLMLVFSAALMQAQGRALRAGVAEADITPPLGIRLWGYSDREDPATGTLDRLYARVLVLEAGTRRLGLVTVDLGRSFGPASLEWLRNATRNDVSFLILAASHTHSGPVVQDEYSDGTPGWESGALKQIARAITEAREHLIDARIGTGYGVTYIGHNRLRVNQDGTARWFERNLSQVPTAPVDGTVSVMRVDATTGQPIAILVNYACHPVIFGSDNLQYSADFPAAMARTVEGAFERKTLCFFLQGAPGDINPYFAVTPIEGGAVQMRDWTGQKLGREAVRIAKSIQAQADDDADLQVAEDRLPVRLRWDPTKWRDAMLAVFGPNVFQTFPSKLTSELQLPVTVVLINRSIALLFLPGEAFVEYQIAWRQRCPTRDAFLVGYANGYFGYFPTIRSATLGGYGAANPATWVEVGAGDRMLDDGVLRINQMLHRLSAIPEDLKK
jgi:neutral ceramidase